MATAARVDTSGDTGRASGKGGVQSYVAPQPDVRPPVVRDPFTVTSVAPTLDAGGGSYGGSADMASQAAARPSLEDYIKSNFLYTSQDNENQRMLDDFDAETMRKRQDTEAEQAIRMQDLGRTQADLGQANAEDFASRGLLRSGGTFQAQDRINARGAEQSASIAQLLTDLLGQRQQGRQQQEQVNRGALNERINQLTGQFNSGQAF